VNFEGFTRADGYVATPLNHARFFFNSGGRIRISSNRAGGSPTPQNNSWTVQFISDHSFDIGIRLTVDGLKCVWLNGKKLTNSFIVLKRGASEKQKNAL
jgi:hypothetical protein